MQVLLHLFSALAGFLAIFGFKFIDWSSKVPAQDVPIREAWEVVPSDQVERFRSNGIRFDLEFTPFRLAVSKAPQSDAEPRDALHLVVARHATQLLGSLRDGGAVVLTPKRQQSQSDYDFMSDEVLQRYHGYAKLMSGLRH